MTTPNATPSPAQGGTRNSEFASSSVRKASYDLERATLTLEFRSGRRYRYDNVPESVYEWLVRAPSKGAYVTRLIKDHYAFVDVTPGPEPLDLSAALEASLAAQEGSPNGHGKGR